MDTRKDRLHELKIACAILDVSMRGLGREWDCSDTIIYRAAQMQGISARIRKKVIAKIAEAQEVVPFDYSQIRQVA